uniref:Lipoprotein n=1 Tax=Streptomyces sp. NBC_00049 TaxID=2903617 RepID=A0AAU2JXM1_9ACTN
MRHAGLTGTMVLVAAVVLTGCSPARLDLVAAYNGDDGKPWIMLAPCGRDDITWVSMSSRPTDPTGSAGPTASTEPTGPTEPTASPSAPSAERDSGWWSSRIDPGIRGGSLPLFEPPASWRARSHGAQRLLPGDRYGVEFYSPDDGAYYGEVSFTAEDLAGLEPGEVWAGGRAMTRSDFREHRAGRC